MFDTNVGVCSRSGEVLAPREGDSVREPFGAFETIDPWYTLVPPDVASELTLTTEIENAWEVSKSAFPEAEGLLRVKRIVPYPFDSLDELLGVKNVSCPAATRSILFEQYI